MFRSLLVSRAVSLDDCRAISEIFTDPSYLAIGILSRHTATDGMLRSIVEGVGKEDQAYFLASVDGEVVMALHLTNIDKQNNNAELHLASRPTMWGSGLLAPVGRRVLWTLFEELKLHRVYGFTPSWNQRVIQSAVLVGGRIEGYIEKGWFCDGTWHRTCALGLLSSEAIYRRRPSHHGTD